MQLYYGSSELIEKPEFNSPKSNPLNDFGKGFYLTPDKPIARLWASRYDKGYCITYSLALEKLNVLYLNDVGEENIMKWISILVNHRFSKDEYEANKQTIEWMNEHFKLDIEKYDVVVGYRADDAYFSYSRDFIENNLSLEKLTEAMHLGKLGIQYFLNTQKAFSALRFNTFEIVAKSSDYKLFRSKTLSEYTKLKKEDKVSNTFIRDIMRRTMK